MPLLVLLLIVVPIAELAAIIQVGQWIGVIPTVVILLVDSLLGAWLLKRQGMAAWRRFRETMNSGRIPARETADGGLIILGGALLLTPGFLTDIAGFLLLTPPTRATIRQIVMRRVSWGMAGRIPNPPRPGARARAQRNGTATGAAAPAAGHRPRDIDTTATEID